MDTVIAECELGVVLRYPQSFRGDLISQPYGHSSTATNKKRRKKKRVRELNKGEAQQQEYHTQIEKYLTMGYHTLLSLGQEAQYFPVQQHPPAGQHSGPCLELVSLCSLDALVPIQEPSHPLILGGRCLVALFVQSPRGAILFQLDSDEDCELFGHVVSNNGPTDLTVTSLGVRFLVPAESSFLLSDLSKIDLLLTLPGYKFDLVVIDSPWENRSAIRGKKYSWLSNEQLFQIPLSRLTAPGAIVAVWVTNKRSIADFVRYELFVKWGIRYIGEWHWIKVTTEGTLVWPMDSTHKKPYESLLIGRVRKDGEKTSKNDSDPSQTEPCGKVDDDIVDTSVRDTSTRGSSSNTCEAADFNGPCSRADSNEHCTAAATPAVDASSSSGPPAKKLKMDTHNRAERELPSQLVFLSVPSSTHSQKPYLGDLLSKYIPGSCKKLELFARNLLPGWTSWGNEVLKFQALKTN